MKIFNRNSLAGAFLVAALIYVIFEVIIDFTESSLDLPQKIIILLCSLFIGSFLGNFRSLIIGLSISKKEWIVTFILFLIGCLGIVIIYL